MILLGLLVAMRIDRCVREYTNVMYDKTHYDNRRHTFYGATTLLEGYWHSVETYAESSLRLILNVVKDILCDVNSILYL